MIPETDNTTGPRAELAGMPAQVDYRRDPSHGQADPAGYACPTYDAPIDGPVVAPQPDSQIRCYDTDDAGYNTLVPDEPTRLPGFTPSLEEQLAWERRASHLGALGL